MLEFFYEKSELRKRRLRPWSAEQRTASPPTSTGAGPRHSASGPRTRQQTAVLKNLLIKQDLDAMWPKLYLPVGSSSG